MTTAEANALGLAGAPQRTFLNGAPVHNWYDDVLADEAGAWSKANQTTGPNSQATPENIAAWNKLVADQIAARQAAANPNGAARAAFERENPMPPMGTPLGEYDKKWRAFKANWDQSGGAGTTPAPATTTPTNQSQSEYKAPRTTWSGAPLLRQETFGPITDGAVSGPLGPGFLPPYLQPGAGGATQIQPQAMLDRNAPAGSWDTINNGVPNIPAAGGASGAGTSPFGRAGTTPTLTGVPGGMTSRTGATGTVAGILNQYNTGGRGGFSATAKMLELPYYLRNLGRQAYGR